jgi:hypothetical protein
MSREELFNWLVTRNALRREASLSPIDVRTEYRRILAQEEWKAICDEHYARVAAELLQSERAKYPDWGNSWGGRVSLHMRTLKILRERYVQEPVDQLI